MSARYEVPELELRPFFFVHSHVSVIFLLWMFREVAMVPPSQDDVYAASFPRQPHDTVQEATMTHSYHDSGWKLSLIVENCARNCRFVVINHSRNRHVRTTLDGTTKISRRFHDSLWQ